jgi:hypothetical protein
MHPESPATEHPTTIPASQRLRWQIGIDASLPKTEDEGHRTSKRSIGRRAKHPEKKEGAAANRGPQKTPRNNSI